MKFITVKSMMAVQYPLHADVGKPRDNVDGERPLSPVAFPASAAPLDIKKFVLMPIPSVRRKEGLTVH